MARNKGKFEKDLNGVIKSAYKKAITSNFDDIVSENDTVSTIANKMSDHVSKIFADELSKNLSTVIDNYLDSLEFDVTKLMSPAGAVSGEIKIIP